MGRRKPLWRIVEKLCLQHYDLLKDELMRDSYYIIRDLIMPFIDAKNGITKEEYEHLISEKGYKTYRDDLWPSIEQKHGLIRPRAKPEGIVIERGKEYTITHLEDVWDRARGFIFTEKTGAAEHLKDLSYYGWIIIAGRGYPTRLMRRLLKEDTRPVLALHDFDPDGEGIYRALGYKTRRTAHLDLELKDRVSDLGLSEEHSKILNLPTQLTPKKYQKRGIFERVELSALSVLKLRLNIKNPILAYTVAMMSSQGIIMSPLPVNKDYLARREIRLKLEDIIYPLISNISQEVIDKVEGKAVDVKSDEITDTIDIPELEQRLKDIAIISGKQHYLCK